MRVNEIKDKGLREKKRVYCNSGVSLGFSMAVCVCVRQRQWQRMRRCSVFPSAQVYLIVWVQLWASAFFIFGVSECTRARTNACVCCSWKCARLSALWSEGRGWAVPLSRLWVNPNTGSYSWPDQVDVRFCPSSALHFHMNVEYAKEEKQARSLSQGATTGWENTLPPPPWQITEILAS